jgi:hypothetical protein
MPLDFDLITTATSYSIDKLKNVEVTDCPDVFWLNNFIEPELLDKFVKFITTEQLEWVPEDLQETAPRLKVNWVFDSVIEEVHMVFENLTPVLNQQFDRNNRFNGIAIWHDLPGYTIGPHQDRDLINLAVQIYVTAGPAELGTKFKHNDRVLQAKYQVNHGYLADNQRGVTHYLDTPVPAGHTRLSVYAVWTSN